MRTGYVTIKVVYEEGQELEQVAEEVVQNLVNCDFNVTTIDASTVNPIQ